MSDVSSPPFKPAQPFRVFISYSRKDVKFLEDLKKHLEPLRQAGLLNIWADQALEIGEIWESRLLHELNESNVIILLDSPDFAASEFINGVELPSALRRQAAGEVLLVRICVRPLNRPKEDPLQAFQFLPRGEKAISEWTEREQDTAWKAVAKELEQRLKSMRSSSSATPVEHSTTDELLPAMEAIQVQPVPVIPVEPPPPVWHRGAVGLVLAAAASLSVFWLILFGVMQSKGPDSAQSARALDKPPQAPSTGVSVPACPAVMDTPMVVVVIDEASLRAFRAGMAPGEEERATADRFALDELEQFLATRLLPRLAEGRPKLIALDFAFARAAAQAPRSDAPAGQEPSTLPRPMLLSRRTSPGLETVLNLCPVPVSETGAWLSTPLPWGRHVWCVDQVFSDALRPASSQVDPCVDGVPTLGAWVRWVQKAGEPWQSRPACPMQVPGSVASMTARSAQGLGPCRVTEDSEQPREVRAGELLVPVVADSSVPNLTDASVVVALDVLLEAKLAPSDEFDDRHNRDCGLGCVEGVDKAATRRAAQAAGLWASSSGRSVQPTD